MKRDALDERVRSVLDERVGLTPELRERIQALITEREQDKHRGCTSTAFVFVAALFLFACAAVSLDDLSQRLDRIEFGMLPITGVGHKP